MPGKHNYGDPAYWDKRYKDSSNQTFDWLQDWSTLRPIIQRLLPNKGIRILNLGCGNASITEKMYDDGYRNIVNIDISKEVIGQVKKRNQHDRPQMKYLVMDVRKLQFQDNSFEFVLDKSTIDALYCGQKSIKSVQSMLKEVHRVLKSTGFYMGLSYGLPKTRMSAYQTKEIGFCVSCHKLLEYVKKQKLLNPSPKQQKNLEHYMYFLTKEPQVLNRLNEPPKVFQEKKLHTEEKKQTNSESVSSKKNAKGK